MLTAKALAIGAAVLAVTAVTAVVALRPDSGSDIDSPAQPVETPSTVPTAVSTPSAQSTVPPTATPAPTTTSAPLPPCTSADTTIHPYNGFLAPRDAAGAGWAFLASTPCHLAGELTFALADPSGRQLPIPGNGQRTTFNVDLPIDPMSIPGVMITWTGRCALQGETYRVIIRTPVGDIDTVSAPLQLTDCATSTASPGITFTEATWSRRTYLGAPLPVGTWAQNPKPAPIYAIPDCGIDIDVCGVLDRLDRWHDSDGVFAGPAPYTRGWQYFCGEDPVRYFETPKGEPVRDRRDVLPMTDGRCTGKSSGDAIEGSWVRFHESNGTTREALTNDYRDAYGPIGALDSLSYGCIERAIPGCGMFAVAVGSPDRSHGSLFLFERKEDEPGYPVMMAQEIYAGAPGELYSGGRISTLYGDAVLKPLP